MDGEGPGGGGLDARGGVQRGAFGGGRPGRVVRPAGDAADAILDVAEEQQCDLIVVGNKGMTGAKRFLLGSVPNKISHHAPCSVLIVRTS
jgi:nucleotide-binding universal stress UspA family protein